MPKKSITFDEKMIRYDVAGAGKAVVLLHGFGVDSAAWKEQIKYLKDRYLVITPDLPGIGASQLTSDVGMKSIAHLIKKIMENEEVEQAAVIGHSMGGYAALAFAEIYPELLTGFGLFHSTSGADNDEKKEARKKGIEFAQKHGAKAFLETTAPKMFSETTKQEKKILYNDFMNQLPEISSEAVISYYKAMMERPDSAHVLKTSKVPVLFIYGDQDEIVVLEKTIEQASFPSVSTIHILKNSGHLGMIEEPAATNKAIEDFLSDI